MQAMILMELWELFAFPMRFSLLGAEDYRWVFAFSHPGSGGFVSVTDLAADLVLYRPHHLCDAFVTHNVH